MIIEGFYRNFLMLFSVALLMAGSMFPRFYLSKQHTYVLHCQSSVEYLRVAEQKHYIDNGHYTKRGLGVYFFKGKWFSDEYSEWSDKAIERRFRTYCNRDWTIDRYVELLNEDFHITARSKGLVRCKIEATKDWVFPQKYKDCF